MSLHIYHRKVDIPGEVKYIDCNDSFFNARTLLHDTELVRTALMHIDNATRLTDDTFQSRVPRITGLWRDHLSTGCKTILNISDNPDMCFNLSECGNSALQMLPKIKEGHAYWRIPACIYFGDPKCDILFCGKHFTNFLEFLMYCREEAIISEKEV